MKPKPSRQPRIRNPRVAARRLFAILSLLVPFAVMTAQAGPHHFQKWAAGKVVDADAGGGRLSLKSADSSNTEVFKVTPKTAVFDGSSSKPSGRNISFLHTGDAVRVLYQEKAGQKIVLKVLANLKTTSSRSK